LSCPIPGERLRINGSGIVSVGFIRAKLDEASFNAALKCMYHIARPARQSSRRVNVNGDLPSMTL